MRQGAEMGFWNRNSAPADRITSEELAEFGRFQFLGDSSGVSFVSISNLISNLGELVFSGNAADRARMIAELRRHAERGEWEKVGAWKYVREFLSEGEDTQDLIDGGLLAIHRMRVTNLAVHLAPVDAPRYRELTGGGPLPHDGFFGPPVFDSEFGPTRQYYFDNAISTAAARTPTRVRSVRGVEPGPVADAAKAMWNFGLLIHRGPLVVNPEISFEPNVVRTAVAAATDVDHDRFVELVALKVFDRDNYLFGPWASIGAARFAEDYLDPETIRTSAYSQLLDDGLTQLNRDGLLGTAMPVELLSRQAHERLLQLREKWR